ncbi:hypothetical protein B0H66DRAFT_341872 [Apodospora peruviana]|uniref:Uncharacterized protein n=1 Tax=Apodospora peruviana TaxID=516989 RepID=A0AAE0M131_9PEZI|nr:hypothetical protein B0H66DRAFT_341872 [Apodospora peruviana]
MVCSPFPSRQCRLEGVGRGVEWWLAKLLFASYLAGSGCHRNNSRYLAICTTVSFFPERVKFWSIVRKLVCPSPAHGANNQLRLLGALRGGGKGRYQKKITRKEAQFPSRLPGVLQVQSQFAACSCCVQMHKMGTARRRADIKPDVYDVAVQAVLNRSTLMNIVSAHLMPPLSLPVLGFFLIGLASRTSSAAVSVCVSIVQSNLFPSPRFPVR